MKCWERCRRRRGKVRWPELTFLFTTQVCSGLRAAENISDEAVRTTQAHARRVPTDWRLEEALQDETGARTAFLKAKEFASQLKKGLGTPVVASSRPGACFSGEKGGLAEATRHGTAAGSKDAFEGSRAGSGRGRSLLLRRRAID